MAATLIPQSPRNLLSARARVVSTVRSWVENGDLADGEPFPSERALADRLGVARGTVRSAMQDLRDEGLLADSGGRRVVRAGSPRSLQSTLMSHTIAVLARQVTAQVTDRIESPGWELFIERGAMDAVFEAGLHGISLNPARLCSGDGLKRLIADHPAGVILGRYAFEHEDGAAIIEALTRAGIPLAVYGNAEAAQQFDHVYSDHAAGARMLTQHLIAQGCRRILRIWPKINHKPYWLADRNRGHEQALREAGLEPVEPITPDTFLPHTRGQKDQFNINARAMVGHLFDYFRGATTRPDAIMVASDGNICWISAALKIMGLQPGKDVHIAGYDNYYPDLIDQQFEPTVPTATVDKRNPEIGREMVNLLRDRIAGKLDNEPQSRIVKPQLMIPNSNVLHVSTVELSQTEKH